MRCSFVSAALLALVSAVFAQTPGFDVFSSPIQDQTVTVGSTFTIKWAPAGQNGTVSITLLQGATPSTLSLGPVLGSGIANSLGQFAWQIPSSVGDFATYGFKISLDSAPTTFQYSFPFHITGGSSASGSATGAPATTTVQLAPGSAYTSSSSSSSSSSTSSSTVSSTPTHSANSTINSLSAVATLPGKTVLSSSPAATSTAVATPNGAIANAATNVLTMVGGLLLAFVL